MPELLRDDYRGPFDPTLDLTGFSRAALAAIGREYMLFGHLLNRAGLPPVHMALGPQAREAVAIEEWMGASPIYTRRMQVALRFRGDDVPTIFKGLQLDVGFAHQYMDVRYELESPQRGYFWLQRCGALLELEPHGEAAVRSMCHAIEDPTFDATAVASNPRARCRPIHRPPRIPTDRVPHCRWEVVIDPGADPVQEIALTDRVRRSRLAQIVFPPPPAAASGGRADYAGAFDPEFALEDLSHAALVQVVREFAVQNHLLVRALMMTVADRGGAALAGQIGAAQWLGCGAVGSERMRAALGLVGDDLETIAKVLQLHPVFVPEYLRYRLAMSSRDRLRLGIADCAALHEADANSWYGLLAAAPAPALDAMVQAINPRARCVAVPPRGEERFAWEVLIDPAAASAAVPPAVAMVRATGTAQFVFRSRSVAP
jgi:hypothetical protein